MYGFLHRYLGARPAYWLTIAWYLLLLMLVLLSFTVPAAEFRYGNLGGDR